MTKKKIFITGMSGYIGTLFVKKLIELDWVESIYGMDLKPFDFEHEKVHFQIMSINSEELSNELVRINPDIVVHLSFIVNPIHDEILSYKVNVEGTENLLHAVKEANVSQLMVASSGTAYGAFPDNPVPLTEEHPIRKHGTFQYANNKAIVEEMTKQFGDENKDIILSIIRPTVVYGEKVDNYLSGILEYPIIPRIKGYSPDLQFVHEDDVVRAMVTIIEKKGRGGYNISPNNHITLSEIIKMMEKKSIFIPYTFAKIAINTAWKLKLKFQKYPLGFMDYMMYPWILSSDKLINELDFKYEYTSKQAISVLIERIKRK